MNMKEVLSNILGYLFVKGIEKEIHGNNINFDTSMAITGNCSYIELFDELNVEELFDYGKQFYDVYEIYLLLVKAKGSQIMHIFKDAATIVQVLGQLYYRGIKEKNLCH